MNTQGFKAYLSNERPGGISDGTIASLISRCRRIEKLLNIDLDDTSVNMLSYEKFSSNIQNQELQLKVISDLKGALKNYITFKVHVK